MKALVVFFLTVSVLFATAPTVENVSFTQRTDGSLVVDIYYDLSDNDAETKKVIVEASADNGSTWNLVCSSLTGDVGDNVAQGTCKHVVWDFYADNPNLDGDQFKVRVTALETGTMTDYDGNTYQTVKIGDQWWMAENLKVTHYNDGFPIGFAENSADWVSKTGGCYAIYNDDISNISTYGLLYNWFVVDPANTRDIAPAGWHVPTDTEWTTLESALGGSSVAGGKAKETGTSHWASPNSGATNESGFTALPGGIRYYDGYDDFINKGLAGYFWTASIGLSYTAWGRFLAYNRTDFYRFDEDMNCGFSVRLIKN